jgi:KaiC/GvpD/RAD55 family RecA-like ATPase
MLNLRAVSDQDRGPSEKITILGPDGTGKSILALHLVSAYGSAPREKDETSDPIVLYVSTDMEYERAKALWASFALNTQGRRAVPFSPPPSKKQQDTVRACDLRLLRLDEAKPGNNSPAGPEALDEYLGRATAPDANAGAKVGFLDLATHTAGDDWSFVARLLELGASRSTKSARNLLVVDSVAGFETLVGRTDAFGRESSRRERIAQFIRAAGEDWHVVFIVEDPRPGEHSPEEFVTDTVIRLRRHVIGMHARLTLDIEKSRSNSHPRGEHPFEIRNGLGSCTGDWQNADDPRAVQPDGVTTNAYIEVFPSLHHISRETACEVGQLPKIYAPSGKVCSFNITCLDNLLVEHADEDRFGLAAGSVTGLLGDDGTRKSLLARHFLMGCFQRYRAVLEDVLARGAGSSRTDCSKGLQKMLVTIFLNLHGSDRKKIDKLTADLVQTSSDFIQKVKDAAARQDLARRFYERAFVLCHPGEGLALKSLDAIDAAKQEIEADAGALFTPEFNATNLKPYLEDGDPDPFFAAVWNGLVSPRPPEGAVRKMTSPTPGFSIRIPGTSSSAIRRCLRSANG